MKNKEARKRARLQERQAAASKIPPASATPPEAQDKSSTTSKKSRWGWILWIKKPVALGWAILTGLLGFSYDYIPEVRLEVADFDPADTRDVLFRITNIGRIHVNNVMMTCEISDNASQVTTSGIVIRRANAPFTGNGIVKVLNPNEPVTRDCADGADAHRFISVFTSVKRDPGSTKIDVTLEYDWPFVGWHASMKRHFSARRRDNNGRYILVPNDKD